MIEQKSPLREAPESLFRTSAKPALIPIAGGRAVPLQRTSNYAAMVTTGVWSFGGLLATSITLLSDRLPDAALGAITVSIVACSVVATVVVARRAAAAATRWVVHFDDTRAALEDRRSGSAVALSRDNAALGVYRYSTKYGSGGVPTVVLAVGARALVVGAPVGTVVTHEHYRGSRAADCTAADPALWEALRRATTRPAE